MRELTDEEKQQLYTQVTDATANMATAIISLQRGDLMKRQIDISTEVLDALGVKVEYNVKEITDGKWLSGKPLL